MLNLFLKKSQTNIAKSELEFFKATDISDLHNNNNIGETRHYPPASKEWFNSIYSYNKNFTKTLPIVDNTVNKLIKSYFNLNPLSNNKKSSRVQVRFKRLSLNRILVSRAEMKHTNNKVIITVYLYNKNKKFFIYKLKNLYKTFIFKIAEKSQKLSSTVRPNTRDARPGTFQKKSLPFAIDQSKTNRAGTRPFVFNKKHKGTGLVKGNSSSSLNKSTITNANGRKKFSIILLNSAPSVKNKGSSLFSSKRFKNSSRGRLAQRNDRDNKTNYILNFTKLTKRNLSNFLLALNIAKKNTGVKALKDKYKSLIKKYYFLLSNNKLNTTSNNNYFLNYVNIAKTNSSLKNNLALLGNAAFLPENSSLYSVEQGEEALNFSLYSLALKKQSFFSTRLASGLAPGQEELETRINNNYYKLFDKVKNSFAFENVFASSVLLGGGTSAEGRRSSQKLLPFGAKANAGSGFAVKKSHKKTITFAGWALYKLRNLHKLFYISPNASEIINANQKNSFELGQEITSDIALKKRNFLLRNLYNILKNKNTLSALLPSRLLEVGGQAKKIISAKASAKRIINAPSLTLKKINSISLKGLRILKKARKNKNFILKTLKWNNTNFRNYETKYYKNFINKSYRKEILYLYYVKMLSLNNNKLKNWFILGLKKIISKIYHKKVEFNFVNLKYLHLNSDIFSESIAIKLKNRENRLLRVLKKALKLVKLPSLSKLSFYGLPSAKINEKFNACALKNESLTLNLNSYISMLKDKDVLHELLYKIFPRWGEANTENTSINRQARSSLRVKNNLQENILNSTKHKNIYGVRLEAAGRLSRRLTASRSVFKLKYKGSLKNINSSYKGLSTVMLRGNTRSNIQLTKISSKTRNGAFGLKGWISSN
jgi:hypothetical protein